MTTLSRLDQLLVGFENSLRSSHSLAKGSGRAQPRADGAVALLSDDERQLSAALMRVNHSGEIAAQALYHGQSLAARAPEIRTFLQHAAKEEADHLNWCSGRVNDLGGRTSRLAPVWYWGSFTIGALAGTFGDKWSLGFIKETEDQVIEHLRGHLQRIPQGDVSSRAIVTQMIQDEGEHGSAAVSAGGAPLPSAVKRLMKLTAKVMTAVSYRF